jgi:Rrf2 family protein
MVHLARQSNGKLSMAAEIALAEDMPEYFFSKIFQGLAKSGLVDSFRGSNGGFKLAKSPDEIKILEIIEAIDGPIAASKCVNAPESCDRSPTCPVHPIWKETQASILTVLSKYSLGDAVRSMERMEQAEQQVPAQE